MLLGRRAKRKTGQPGWLQERKAASVVFAVFLFAAILILTPGGVARAVEVGLEFGTATGLSTVDIRTYVGRIIRYFLSLLGIIAVMLMMYAGFIWMTAGGSEEKIKKAKAIMTNAVIGLVIITSAYAIVLFLFRALTGDLSPQGGSSGPPARLTALFAGNRGNDALGNGIIDYHYPEPGQSGVPRNTKVSITFKKPLVLSSVFKNYDDNNTFVLTDDRLCPSAPPCPAAPLVSSLTNPVFELNTANVKLIPNEGLEPGGSGSLDEQFDRRYPDSAAVVSPAPTIRVTPVTVPLDPLQYQTIVFKPVTAIGSPSTDVNYRVAFRGGENGVKVWTEPAAGGAPEQELAFGRTFADGGYFWSFTTSTLIDTTPPRIVALVPNTTTTPGTPPASVLDRNQLLQVYFDEAIDPTSSSGTIGSIGSCAGGTEPGKRCTNSGECGGGGTCEITSGGFSNVEVKAQCLPGAFPTTCSFNGGNPGTVSGTLVLGNRYRTAEFVPAALCENIAENSCGEPVYCLPKNVKLTVRTLAATIGSDPPAAAVANGVVDMVDNSLDGNDNGTAQGQQGVTCVPPGAQPGGRCDDYYRNDPPATLTTVSDTARWEYHVGSNVDLTVPVVTRLDPPSPPPEGTNHPLGPSNVPTTLEPTVSWSKTMSVGSMRSGGFNETLNRFSSPTSTLVLRSKECAKSSADPCPGVDPPAAATSCPCTDIDPPGFFIDAGLPVPNPSVPGQFFTRIKFVHPFRAFYTANDLGYTEADIDLYPDNIPVYTPIARAQVRDTKQNCFWPSKYKPDGDLNAPECTQGGDEYSCCDRSGSRDDEFLGDCAP